MFFADADNESAVFQEVRLAGGPHDRVKACDDTDPDSRKPDTALLELLKDAKLLQLAAKIEQCGTVMYPRRCQCGAELKALRRRCRRFLCSPCQRRKGYKISREVEAMLEELLIENPGLKVFWGVFTLPACEAEDLRKQIGVLIQGFGTLMRRAGVKAHLIAAVRFIEVPFNSETKTFQPHINAIFVMRATYWSKGYLSQAAWLELWRSATKSSRVSQIKIKRVESDPGKSLSLTGNVANVVRYSMKPQKSTSWTPSSLVWLDAAIRCRRLCEFLGAFKPLRRRLRNDKSRCLCSACLAD